VTKFARLTDADVSGDRLVVEITDNDPEGRFHPSIAAQFIQVPDQTALGSVKNGQAWTHPEPAAISEPAEPVPAYRTKISPVEFKMLFAVSERLAIRAIREYAGADPAQRQAALVIDDWFDILDDPRLTMVDLALPQPQDGLDFLVSTSVLTAERRDEIGKGIAETV